MSRRSPSHDFHLPGDMLHSLVTAGIGAVPAARYAMGCIAVAAALTVVLRTVPDPAVAVFGGLVMLAGMVLVAIVGRVAGGRDTALHSALGRPALALAWGVVGAAILRARPSHHDDLLGLACPVAPVAMRRCDIKRDYCVRDYLL